MSTRKRHLSTGHSDLKFELRQRFDCQHKVRAGDQEFQNVKKGISYEHHIFQDVCLSLFLSPTNLRYAKCQGNIKQCFASQRFHVKNHGYEKNGTTSLHHNIHRKFGSSQTGTL